MQIVSNQFQPIEQITLAAVPTEQAAFYLSRRPQTLRSWSCLENGPLRPVRVNGRLAWPVKEIKKILGIECQ
ncbi:MAG: DNA-binding protein [Proteobacteria bacterium]|nr:DNA-binding protein [Pseudomonadota bacterium]